MRKENFPGNAPKRTSAQSMRHWVPAVFVILLILGFAFPAFPQAGFQQTALLPGSGGVAVSEDYALVQDTIFKRSGSWWVKQATLVPNDNMRIEIQATGHYLDLTDDYAIVGQRTAEKAYIFARQDDDTWIQQAELTPPSDYNGVHFGLEVAISDRFAFVGDPAYSSQGDRVYVFQREDDRWLPAGTLRPEGAGLGIDAFGTGIAVSDDTLLVGADYSDRAYIFTYNGETWTQQAILEPESGAPKGFGVAVNLSGEYAIVGADKYTKPDGTMCGAAYIFKREDERWIQEAKLVPNDGASLDFFGHSVSVSGNYAVAGADGKNIGSQSQPGKAYVYTRDDNQWRLAHELTSGDPAIEAFGFSVELGGGSLFVGNRHSSSVHLYGLTVNRHHISGQVTDEQGIGMAGVELRGLPGNPLTADDGSYQTQVINGWFGEVSPAKPGYSFESRVYSPVFNDRTGQDYAGTLSSQTYTISGTITHSVNGQSVGLAGIRLVGLPGTPITDTQGYYQAKVPSWWTGTVRPEPENRPYDGVELFYPGVFVHTDVRTDIIQDYTLNANIISGKIVDEQGNGLAGVMLEGAPGTPTTAEDGSYKVFLDYFSDCVAPITAGTGLGCRFAPQKEGYAFTPAQREYDSWMTFGDVPGQNYTGASHMPLQNMALKVNDAVFGDNQLRTSSFFDAGSFDWNSGQGQIRMMFRPGTAGEFNIQLSMSYLIDRLMADSLSTTLPASTPDQQLLGLNVEEDGLLSADMGWSVSLTDAEDFATLIFTIGHTMPEEGPYSRVSYLTDAGKTGEVYFSSQLEAVPEPGTFLLLGGGLLGLLAATRRMRRK